MSFTQKLLNSEKKGTIYSLALLLGVLILVVGILSVNALHSRTISVMPTWAGASVGNQSYNFTITNNNGGTINRIDIYQPGNFVDIYCLNPVPSGWSCTRNGTAVIDTFVKFQFGTLAPGASISFNISSSTAASAGENAFDVWTYDDQSAFNESTPSVSIDTLPPSLSLINVSDGARILDDSHFDGTLFLSNSTGRIQFVVSASDNESGLRNVSFYYNASSVSNNSVKADFKVSGSYDDAVAMSNSSFSSASIFNATLDGNSLLNGTRIVFMVVANDTVRNGNASYYSSTSDLSKSYNFTVDGAAPQLTKVYVSNATSVNTNAFNTTSVIGGNAVEYVINATVGLNVSVNVNDNGGAGVTSVDVMDNNGAWLPMPIIDGTNGSSTATVWSLATGAPVTGYARPTYAGEGLYNLSFRITDNVSNARYSNFSVQVDDSAPTLSANTNLSYNITPTSTLNSSIVNVSVTTTNLVNNLTQNVTVTGANGAIYNMTLLNGAPSTTAVWATQRNLSDMCNFLNVDGVTCALTLTAYDVLGRSNTASLTVYLDNAAPNVSIDTPVTLTNYSTSVTITGYANDSIGPLSNVSFRWRNGSIAASDMGAWNTMTLVGGTNTQLSAQAYWQATLVTTGLVGGNYSIEINATDSAGRQNAAVNVTNIVIDNLAPAATVTNPASNSFKNAAFTLNLTVNDSTDVALDSKVSNISSVQYRRENSTTDVTPWAAMGSVDGNSINYSITIASGSVSNGNYTYRFNVTDFAGNSNTSVAINVTIDTVTPLVSFVSPLSNQNKSTNFTINVSVTETDVNTVQYRWVNDSSKTSGVGPWVSLNLVGGPNSWNATFGNLTDGSVLFDGNYSIEIRVTDKAGNSNATEFVQLLLDKTVPVVQLVGAAGNSIASNSIYNSTTPAAFTVNVTVNDSASWNMLLGNIVSTNINTVTFKVTNRSVGSSGETALTASMNVPTISSGGNYSNATFAFSAVPNGVYDINITTNDTAGNINYTLVRNITLDDTAPTVRVINTTPAASGGLGLSGTIVINVTVTDNLGYNENGLDNSSVNVTFISSAGAVAASYRMTTGMPGSAERWNASILTTALDNGDYFVYINATDKAGNRNSTQFISVTIQNGGTNPSVNVSFSDGFFTGSTLTSENPTRNSVPTVQFNLSSNATCKYVLDSGSYTSYANLPTTMSNSGSRQNRITTTPLRDGTHSVYYSCYDVAGNYTPRSDGSVERFTFNVETTSLWNVTIPGKTDSKWPNYFQPASAGSANGWSSFVLSTGALADTTLASAQGGYNVTNVLASLLQGTGAGNFTRIYAYTASTNSWETFVVGQTANTLINFTNQTTYWVNVTAAERLEIN